MAQWWADQFDELRETQSRNHPRPSLIQRAKCDQVMHAGFFRKWRFDLYFVVSR